MGVSGYGSWKLELEKRLAEDRSEGAFDTPLVSGDNDATRDRAQEGGADSGDGGAEWGDGEKMLGDCGTKVGTTKEETGDGAKTF
jgi:hypothetical protein